MLLLLLPLVMGAAPSQPNRLEHLQLKKIRIVAMRKKEVRLPGSQARSTEMRDFGNRKVSCIFKVFLEVLTRIYSVETGEEGEDTIFSCRGKLLHMDGKEWKEKGVGIFKLNVAQRSDDDDEDGMKKMARLVMRNEATFKVVLNVPVFKGMKVGTINGEKPQGQVAYISTIENGKLAMFCIRVWKP